MPAAVPALVPAHLARFGTRLTASVLRRLDPGEAPAVRLFHVSVTIDAPAQRFGTRRFRTRRFAAHDPVRQGSRWRELDLACDSLEALAALGPVPRLRPPPSPLRRAMER